MQLSAPFYVLTHTATGAVD